MSFFSKISKIMEKRSSKDPGQGQGQGQRQKAEIDYRMYLCPLLSTCPGGGNINATAGIGPSGDSKLTSTNANVVAECPYKNHSPTPYQWRITDDKGNVSFTFSLEHGKLLEKSYSNPDLTSCVLDNKQMIINFTDMKVSTSSLQELYRGRNVQRITTPPNILFPDLASRSLTNWIWYWQSDDIEVNWSEMNYQRDVSEAGDPMEALERLYMDQKPVAKKLTLIGQRDRYPVVVNFQKLTMFMSGDDMEYEVRRRPDTFSTFIDWCYLEESVLGRHWVTFGDLNPCGDTRYPITGEELEVVYQRRGFCPEDGIIKLPGCGSAPGQLAQPGYTVDVFGQTMHATNGQTIKMRRDVFRGIQLLPLENYPSNWDPMPKFRIYVSVIVPSFSDEFKNIQALVSGYTLTRLRRIQNPAAFNSYQEVKAQFEAAFPSKVQEMTVFHGTSEFNIKLICETNFDPKLAGTSTGTAYGRGCYFGKTFMTSLTYCKQKSPLNPIKIFICKIIVASMARGYHAEGKNPADLRVTLVNDDREIIVNRVPHSFRPEYIAEFMQTSALRKL